MSNSMAQTQCAGRELRHFRFAFNEEHNPCLT
jgi:hypothetical protein